MSISLNHMRIRFVLILVSLALSPLLASGAVLDAAAQANIRMEADYILSCQYKGSSSYGAFNNVHGDPTWVVPGENAVAILGLVAASDALGDSKYRTAANAAADYLVSVQTSDGAWYNQYSFSNPTDLAKGLRHTAETMMAYHTLGYSASRYNSMTKAAQFLLNCQNTRYKLGINDGLVGGGKNASGGYETWRWASDNAFAYQAFQSAADWARTYGGKRGKSQASTFEQAANRILTGMQTYLLASSGDHWYRSIDKYGQPVALKSDWIGYAPLMLNLPIPQATAKAVADWISRSLQQSDGSVVWDDAASSARKSPGYSFQASLAWLNAGVPEYANAAMDWVETSGLWQLQQDYNGLSGGWIDWIEGTTEAPWWQRFIDTSAYYITTKTWNSNTTFFSLPEPSTTVMMLVGLVLLRCRRKSVMPSGGKSE